MEQLFNNLKGQAQLYLLDAGEFFPFGAYIDKSNNIIPLSAYVYDEDDRPSSAALIEILENHIKNELLNRNYLCAAIAIPILVKDNGKQYDAIEVRIFEENSTYKKHIRYSINTNRVDFY